MPVVTVEPFVFNLDLILVGGLPRVDLTITKLFMGNLGFGVWGLFHDPRRDAHEL